MPHRATFTFGAVTLDTKINRVTDRNGAVLCYVVCWEDVSRRHALESALAGTLDKLLSGSTALQGSCAILTTSAAATSEEAGSVARTLEVSNRAVATSGDYERFFRYRGERFHHLMDPRTAAPRRTSVRSVTVLADRCIDAEPCAVSVFGLAQAEAEAFARKQLRGAEVITLS